jgi:hypothetical protein
MCECIYVLKQQAEGEIDQEVTSFEISTNMSVNRNYLTRLTPEKVQDLEISAT